MQVDVKSVCWKLPRLSARTSCGVTGKDAVERMLGRCLQSRVLQSGIAVKEKPSACVLGVQSGG